MTHYDENVVRAQAVDLGRGYTFAGLVLGKRDTAWNPASTKGPLCGPSLVEYRMHPSGIEIMEVDADHACMGGDRLESWPYWKACNKPPVPGGTRCEQHDLRSYAVTV